MYLASAKFLNIYLYTNGHINREFLFSADWTVWEEAVLGLGIQTEKDKFDLGDSIPFTLKLELPELDEAASLSVLISGTNAEETRSSVMFCSPTIKKNVKKQDEVF